MNEAGENAGRRPGGSCRRREVSVGGLPSGGVKGGYNLECGGDAHRNGFIVMSNSLIVLVDAFAAMVSPAMEATFDYIEYRIAANRKRKQEMRVEYGAFLPTGAKSRGGQNLDRALGLMR
jgi:hypothetical protein